MIDALHLPEGMQGWWYTGTETASLAQYTWTKPAGVSFVYILLVGAGGGGAGGSAGGTGGGGGASGTWCKMLLPGFICPDVLFIDLPTGGAGGAGGVGGFGATGSKSQSATIRAQNVAARNTAPATANILLSVSSGNGGTYSDGGASSSGSQFNRLASVAVTHAPPSSRAGYIPAYAGPTYPFIFNGGIGGAGPGNQNVPVHLGDNYPLVPTGGNGYVLYYPALMFLPGAGGTYSSTGGRGGDGAPGSGGGGGGGSSANGSGGNGGSGGPGACLIFAW